MLEESSNSYPVCVVMERRNKKQGRWSYTEWQVTGILTNSELLTETTEKRLIHRDEACERYLWTNFVIQLYRDDAESYWNNLMARQPYLFVVARVRDDQEEMEPFLVSANYDEIIGFMEVDDSVYSIPIPPPVYRWLETYVVNNYQPKHRRKRKRAQWAANSNEQDPPARRH